ncbi:hypothetical protein ADUPG1_012591 [Aduncisulcus paluster]|uniref:Uncharacterized protein n=1 Tax=Aduncisulcus paluster TaxID=2918883 RepID=A0ABQ5JZX9_9EUKA|nr:hypothetical protein ADUPG1_012591 [Aduncisulcus paluster]
MSSAPFEFSIEQKRILQQIITHFLSQHDEGIKKLFKEQKEQSKKDDIIITQEFEAVYRRLDVIERKIPFVSENVFEMDIVSIERMLMLTKRWQSEMDKIKETAAIRIYAEMLKASENGKSTIDSQENDDDEEEKAEKSKKTEEERFTRRSSIIDFELTANKNVGHIFRANPDKMTANSIKLKRKVDNLIGSFKRCSAATFRKVILNVKEDLAKRKLYDTIIDRRLIYLREQEKLKEKTGSKEKATPKRRHSSLAVSELPIEDLFKDGVPIKKLSSISDDGTIHDVDETGDDLIDNDLATSATSHDIRDDVSQVMSVSGISSQQQCTGGSFTPLF